MLDFFKLVLKLNEFYVLKKEPTYDFIGKNLKAFIRYCMITEVLIMVKYNVAPNHGAARSPLNFV